MCVNLKVRWSCTLNWEQIWKVNKRDLDKLKINKDIRHKHGKEIYFIKKIVINVLWKEIISCLWVHTGATLDVLCKWNIAFLWVLANDFVSTIVVDFDKTMILVALERLSPYLFMHIKNIQIGSHMCYGC
jgi:hypothetical protein